MSYERLLKCLISKRLNHDTANISDKVFWIVNRTADVDAVQVFYGFGPIPLVNDGQGCSAAVPGVPSQGRDICNNMYSPNDLSTRFPTYPAGLSFPRSQCFAASFPVNLEQSLYSGPSGVFCSSTDFGSLFSRNGTELDNFGACCKNFDYEADYVTVGGGPGDPAITTLVGETYDCKEFCGNLRKCVY